MAPAALAAAGDINTVAGTGTPGFSGDEGPATAAKLQQPYGVAVDGSGNLYIADASNHRVRKVNGSGTITTVAGIGSAGFSGDGGPATSAELSDPYGVAVDGSGNLYIADTLNHRVRKVDGSGTITTVAGTGTAGFSGDGGLATSAELDGPWGMAVDGSGNLYIADQGNSRVRKVDGAGTITTVAGTITTGFSGDEGPATSAELFYPEGVAVDGSGNLYIAEHSNERVRKVNGSGTITTVAGTGTAGFSGDGGSATAARFNAPYAVAVDGSGDLYIADYFNQRVRKVNGSGTITTVAGIGSAGFSGDGGSATSAQLNGPIGLAVDGASNLYIADLANQRVRKVEVDTVPPPNSPPTADSQSLTTAEDHAKTITLAGADPDHDPLSFRITKLAGHGALYDGTGTAGHRITAGDLPYSVQAPARRVTYAPADNYNGEDHFSFRTNDGAANSDPATVSITVTPINDPPIAHMRTWKDHEGFPDGDHAVATFHDVDGQRPNTYTATVHWGDGSVSSGEIEYACDAGPPCFDYVIFGHGIHIYKRFGTYNVRVQVVDTHGGSDSVTSKAKMSDEPIYVGNSSGGRATVGRLWGPYPLTCVYDHNPFGVASDLRAKVHWADGTSSDAPIRPATDWCNPDADFEIRGSHTWQRAGDRAIIVSVTSLGGSADSGTASVTVR